MQPLVYYCRWNEAKLRLRGRDEVSVWGELVYEAGSPQEWTQRFRYDLHRRELMRETETGQIIELLDDMGVVVSSSADGGPQ
ncbi:MAG: hypothetical protein R3C44_16570 [Chloroflexota bacterium]